MMNRSTIITTVWDNIFRRIVNLLMQPDNEALRESFEDFHQELKRSIDDGINRSKAINMIAQHILSRPVFEVLFESYTYASDNTLLRELNYLLDNYSEFRMETQMRGLEEFYRNVRQRANNSNNYIDRQRLLSELYEEFFKKIMRRSPGPVSIFFTPIEIVDFMLHSVNDILQDEFEQSLSNEGIHVLDPFVGSGTFLSRLIQSGLIQPDDLLRKFQKELHANEVDTFAYYLASLNIEGAFHMQREDDGYYESFKGILLTDTFNLNIEQEPTQSFRDSMLNHNNKQTDKEQDPPFQVIVGNPPWSSVYRVRDEDYSYIEDRIRDTYGIQSMGFPNHRLYETYKMAFRWASDKIGKQGIIAFVTNGSWISGSSDAGIRACFAEEFSTIYILNLGGSRSANHQQRYYEGENVFTSRLRDHVLLQFW